MRRIDLPACLLVHLCLSAATLHGQVAEKLQRARDLMVAGQADEAVAIFQELVQASPNDPAAVMNLGIALAQAGRYREAIAQSEAALKLQPDFPTANLFLGMSYIEVGETARGVEPLEKVLQQQPDNRYARGLLADAMLSLERFDQAAFHFRKLSELAPDSPAVWYGLGQSYEFLFRRALTEMEASGRDSAYWLALAADYSLKQKLHQQAFHYYREALAKQPDMRSVYAGLAAVYRETGRADWAAWAEQKLRGFPPPDCKSLPLECDFQAGLYDRVLEAARSRRTSEARYWEARACLELANQAYSRLGRLPPSAESHGLAAKAYEDRGLYLEAAKEWQKALNLARQNRRLRLRLASALCQGRDYSAALPLLEELLHSDADSPEVNLLYGRYLLHTEQADKAIPFLERALKHDADFLPARGALGQALLLTGKPEQAIPHLKASLETDDEEGSRHFQLVRAYQLAGQPELARQALQQYQNLQKAAAEKRKLEQGGQITGPESLERFSR